MTEPSPGPSNFIRDTIIDDLKTNKYGGRVHTRFPPEPNGYLHVGHAKSINLNFGLAEEFGGKCNLRFDDTNPSKEETEYVDSIIEDVRWLGGDWEDRLFYASDYFGQLYDWAVQLIKDGKAYVCDLTAEQVRQTRGTLTEPGQQSPYRDRSVEENLDLFERMRAGEFPDGARTLRAKIDMAAANLNMRDPVMYRILHAEHHRTGNKWCIYPMYDFAHGQSDSIEGITHSICTLEFEDHRPLYDWYIEQLGIYHPQQIEFDRLNVTYTHDEQAQAAHAGAERLRFRLERSAHAHHFRNAAAGLFARGDPQFLPQSGRVEDQRHHRARPARILRARGSEQARAARDGGVAAAARGDRELSRRPGGTDGGGEQSRGLPAGNAHGAVLASAVYRAGRFSRRSAQAVFPAVPGHGKSGCATATSSPAPAWSRTKRAR